MSMELTVPATMTGKVPENLYATEDMERSRAPQAMYDRLAELNKQIKEEL